MQIAAAAGNGRFVGIDSSSEMIAAAVERAGTAEPTVTFREGSAVDLPFTDGEFDAVRCERMLQWLEDPQPAVDEMVRVVRPGGRIVLLDTDWRTFGLTVDQQLQTSMFEGDLLWPSPHAGGFLRHYLFRAGLRDIEVKSVVHHTTTWAGDASDGLFAVDSLIDFAAATGREPSVVHDFIEELRSQSDEGSLSVTLTMFGATGTTPI